MPRHETGKSAVIFCQNSNLEAFFLRNLRPADDPRSCMPLNAYEIEILVATLGWSADNGEWQESGLRSAEGLIHWLKTFVGQADVHPSSPLQAYLKNTLEADPQRRVILESWLDDFEENLDFFIQENGGNREWSNTLRRLPFLQVVLVALVVNGLPSSLHPKSINGEGIKMRRICRPDIHLV